ncbi:MAG: 2-amino-4-hydroxy-6-hydroxymethyldihydropteridine diphosphokinase [Chlorobiales bacterium]|nr:2-amino-4-hydroxy-6-hydroxymethyldihydropteridine diphosphokinase [Chlorobiales bacterium]
MEDVFIGLGTNIGNRLSNLREAVRALQALPDTTLIAVSSAYETPPIGFSDQDNFYNAVCLIQTALEPEDLFYYLKQIERQLGRPEQYERWGPRIIDLDILLYGDMIFKTDTISIPHIEMPNRKFVLVPLLELQNPIHPILRKTIKELVAECKDPSLLKKLPDGLLEKN